MTVALILTALITKNLAEPEHKHQCGCDIYTGS